MNRNKLLIFCGIFLLLLLFFYYRKYPLKTKIYFNNQIIYTEVAVTSGDKEKGLGRRENLPADGGMLFVYDNKEKYPFWMKDMQFPLDFIWLDGYEVVEVTENVPVLTDGKVTTLAPSRPADKILEVNAGTVKKLGIKVGDIVVIRN